MAVRERRQRIVNPNLWLWYLVAIVAVMALKVRVIFRQYFRPLRNLLTEI